MRKHGCKQYYYILTNNTKIIKAESKWEELFHSDINWKNIYSKPFKTRSDTKLRRFQCRLLHRIITNNMFLLKINKAKNNIFTFCKGTPETNYIFLGNVFQLRHFVMLLSS